MANGTVVLYPHLTSSRAWQEMLLSSGGGTAVLVYVEILTRRVFHRLPGKKGKKKRLVCVNNGKIKLTYKKVEELWGLRPARFRRALDMLESFGFIDVKNRGTGIRGDPSLYAESERWSDWGTTQFRRSTRVRGGFGWAKRKPAGKKRKPTSSSGSKELSPAEVKSSQVTTVNES